MSDDEVVERYHKLMLNKLKEEKASRPEPKAMGKYFYFKACPMCGNGRVPNTELDGWYIDYHMQDGHETCGPYTKEVAVDHCRNHTDKTSHATLIGPDGQIYTF